MRDFDKLTSCRLCSMPMTHYRLYGYRCHNPEHREILNNIYSKAKYDDDKIEQLIREYQIKHGYIRENE